MKFLIYSNAGYGAGIAHKLREEGEDVSIYFESADNKTTLKGIVNTAGSLSAGLARLDKNKDIVIFDYCGSGKIGEALKVAGYQVLFASNFADLLDKNQTHALNLCDKAGILTGEADGPEVWLEMWFQSGEPIYPALGILKATRFLAGDLGMDTKGQTAVVFAYKEKEPRIVGQTIKKLFLLFKAAKFTGPVSLKCHVNPDMKAVVSEVKPGIQYNSFYAFCSMLNISLGTFLNDLTFGNMGTMDMDMNSFGYAMKVTLPPYPALQDAMADNVPIEASTFEDCYLYDVKKENGKYLSAGKEGCIMDIACKGKTIRDAEDNVKYKFRDIVMENKQARITDGADAAMENYRWLDMAGFLVSGAGNSMPPLILQPAIADNAPVVTEVSNDTAKGNWPTPQSGGRFVPDSNRS